MSKISSIRSRSRGSSRRSGRSNPSVKSSSDDDDQKKLIEEVSLLDKVKMVDLINPMTEKRRLLLAVLDTNSAHSYTMKQAMSGKKEMNSTIPPRIASASGSS